MQLNNNTFNKIKKNQWIINIAMILLLILVIFFQSGVFFKIKTPSIFLYFELGTLIGLYILSIKNWRCPSCGKYIGKGMNHKTCPHCNIHYD